MQSNTEHAIVRCLSSICKSNTLQRIAIHCNNKRILRMYGASWCPDVRAYLWCSFADISWESCSRYCNRAAFREKEDAGPISRVCRSLFRDNTALVRIFGALFFGENAQDASISHEKVVRGAFFVWRFI